MLGLEASLTNCTICINYFMKNWGLTVLQAIGIAANIYAESTGDPHSYNSSEKSGQDKNSRARGNGNYGAGIVQWTFTNTKSALQKYMNKYSAIETWTLQELLQALTLQLKHEPLARQVLTKLKTVNTISDCTYIWLYGFEMGKGARYNESKTTFINSGNSRYTSRSVWIGPKLNNFLVRNFSTTNEMNLVSRISYGNMLATYLKILPDWVNLSVEASTASQILSNNIGGGFTSQQMQYPVHSEYITFSLEYNDLFKQTNSKDNTLKINNLTDKGNLQYNLKVLKGRIYSINDPIIVLDELSLPINNANDVFVSSDIKNSDRHRLQQDYDKMDIKNAVGNVKNVEDSESEQ